MTNHTNANMCTVDYGQVECRFDHKYAYENRC